MKQLAKIVTLSIVPLLVFMLVNQSVNLHYHKMDDGVVVSHAHPYADTNDLGGESFPQHEHTKTQFFILAQLTTGFAPILVFFAISFILFAFRRLPVPVYDESFVLSRTAGLRLLRAPPALT